MEDSYNINHNGVMRQRSGVWRSLRDGDFDEEDIWSNFKDNNKSTFINNDHSSLVGASRSLKNSSSSKSTPRAIPRSTNSSQEANYSSSSSSKIVHQSAPMNIPNWPTSLFGHTNDATNKPSNDHDSDDDDGIDDDDDDDDDEGLLVDDMDYNKLPPHEFIARRLAKTQISSFSVFEGVGRTLKGRDLSKVRNAVLTKTGFLESL